MSAEFPFDVFLSHSTKDKPAAREIAELLRKDGVKVWFDDWELKPGDNILAKIEEGLELSRVLVLCMSANAMGSDWTQLEAGTFRFRDPLNRTRSFIPLRLDDTPIEGPLAQFLYIDWVAERSEKAYPRLLEACRPPVELTSPEAEDEQRQGAQTVNQLRYKTSILSYAFSLDGESVLTGGIDETMRLSDVKTMGSLQVFKGHKDWVWCVAWDEKRHLALSGGSDKSVRLWDLDAGNCLRVFDGHRAQVYKVLWSTDGLKALSSSADKTVRLWDVSTGQCIRVFEGHRDTVWGVAWTRDQQHVLSGSGDKTIRLWDMNTGRCLRVLEGHTGGINALVWTSDQQRALSVSDDKTLRLWDVHDGRCLSILKGHTKPVLSVAVDKTGRWAISGSEDKSVRLWNLDTARCVRVLEGHTDLVWAVAWIGDDYRALSGDQAGTIQEWNLADYISAGSQPKSTSSDLATVPDQVQYTNAKVLLVGETGAGKTGLSMRIALHDWHPSDSTVGAWATQLKLPVSGGDQIEREIWLWDFGGQADQRLIHQLYMDDTALAILVFDGQKEDLFETLGQWDRDLSRASSKEFAKLLVAGRVDAGGLRVSKAEIEKFKEERGFKEFLETSAKTNKGCNELEQAILKNINWDEIPCRTTEVLFKRLKDEIIRLKDEGRVLMRFNALRETLRLRLSGRLDRFTDEQLLAVVTLLGGPGVVWELKFGSWVLLQPERINAYAQAVIRTLQTDEQQRGCLLEERVLRGDLEYDSSMERLEGDEERFVLLAMHQTLVERGICLRQPTEKGNLLIFPSYYRRERPEQVGHPAIEVSYRFTGFLDEIYATLVVRLHHTEVFSQDRLWRYAADFRTNLGKQVGIKLTRWAPGEGELDVYFDAEVPMEEKIIFSKYVHEHLLEHAQNVDRLRHYVCPNCGTLVGNREVAMKRLNKWLQNRHVGSAAQNASLLQQLRQPLPSIVCAECEKQVSLWDDMEQYFASPGIQQRVQDMQEESAIVLDNESKERALVGEVISTVALAGQIAREFSVSDHGIDMEVEFKDDNHQATGAKIYLQLKSGDSYLRTRKNEEMEIFSIKEERHARYWMSQAFPVLLVVRNAEGEIRWMEVKESLTDASKKAGKPIKQIVFKGERFDVMSVRRWRDRLLGAQQREHLV